MEQRLNRRRWMPEVRHICSRLGTYTFLDVRRELRLTESGDARNDIGRCAPSDKELSAVLCRAEWSEKVQPRSGHKAAVYRFSSDDSGDPDSCEADGGGDQ